MCTRNVCTTDEASIGRLGKRMSDFKVVRHVVRQTNETV